MPTDVKKPRRLADFRGQIPNLTVKEREQIVDAAYVLIDQAYSHLSYKQAMYGIDPLQKLRLLRYRLKGIAEYEFQDNLITIFADLRDMHTTYRNVAPLNNLMAYIPFSVGQYYEGDTAHYMITKVYDANLRNIKSGMEITHWNGTQMARAVELNGARLGGSNPEARLARAIQMMTFRPLSITLPPDEDWVDLRYRDGKKERRVLFDWMVWDQAAISAAAASGTLKSKEIDPYSVKSPGSHLLGMDLVSHEIKEAQRTLIKRSRRGKRMKKVAPGASEIISTLPQYFSARTVDTPSGTYAYIKIIQFNIQDAEEFAEEFMRLLGLVPQNGLILDVMGNQGGNILAGELCLQLLSPIRIEPERFIFRNTAMAATLTGRDRELVAWHPSIKSATETGAVYSRGFQIDPTADCNRIGQRYHGPVVLLTDALCYSTTDMFAAGFQDHRIGPILGVSGRTGAGGGNVWTYEALRDAMGKESPFKPLPREASFTVALRHSLRVRRSSGVSLEDIGVVPDAIHRLTRNDLLRENVELLACAGEMLAKLPVRILNAELSVIGRRKVRLIVSSAGFSRLDVYLEDHPYTSVKSVPSIFTLELEASANFLGLQGFDRDRLVATRRLVLPFKLARKQPARTKK